MREYRCKGRRLDNGEWVYGYMLKAASTFIAIDTCLVDGHWELHVVDPATVGQYLCINDSNGKEIYEGDVVRWWAGEHEQGHWQYGGVLRIEYAFDYDTVGKLANSDGREILGNIHDKGVE